MHCFVIIGIFSFTRIFFNAIGQIIILSCFVIRIIPFIAVNRLVITTTIQCFTSWWSSLHDEIVLVLAWFPRDEVDIFVWMLLSSIDLVQMPVSPKLQKQMFGLEFSLALHIAKVMLGMISRIQYHLELVWCSHHI